MIGKGSFEKILLYLLESNRKKTQKHYAIQEMSKAQIIDKKIEENILNEKNLLLALPNNLYISY